MPRVREAVPGARLLSGLRCRKGWLTPVVQAELCIFDYY